MASNLYPWTYGGCFFFFNIYLKNNWLLLLAGVLTADVASSCLLGPYYWNYLTTCYVAQTIKNSVSISWQLNIQSSHPKKKQHKHSQIANVEAFVWGIQNPAEDVTVTPSVQICSLWEAVGLREGEQELEEETGCFRQCITLTSTARRTVFFK